MNKEERQELVSAKAKHYLFKSKLRSYLQDSPDVDEKVLVNYNACGLGIWINEIGKKKFGSYAEIEELDIIHQQIHATAKEIVDLKKQGFQKNAEDKLKEINKIGNEIVGKIDELNDLLQGGGKI